MCPLFTDEPTESLETYGETSCVRTWNGRFGELLREDGDTIFFHKNSVMDRFEGRLVNLSVGDYVYHGVGKRDDGRWHAVAIELFSEAEQERLQQGLPAQEPELEPEPESASLVAAPALSGDSVLAPEKCNKTLLQLIFGSKDEDMRSRPRLRVRHIKNRCSLCKNLASRFQDAPGQERRWLCAACFKPLKETSHDS